MATQKRTLKVKDRIYDNGKARTEAQKNIDRLTGVTDSGYRAELSRLRTQMEQSAKGQRFVNGRIARGDKTRYNSTVRTGEGRVGRQAGTGTMVTRRYQVVSAPTGPQPVNSGNGNSPPVIVGSGRQFRGTSNVSRTTGLTSAGLRRLRGFTR